MQLVDSLKDAEVENLALKIELRDLRYAIGKYEDAIEQALEDYDTTGGNADRMVVGLRDALMKP